jgi:hypothetical protein
MRHVLEILDDLAYISEVLAQDLPGEAKTELYKLIRRFEAETSPPEPTLALLREAVQILIHGNERRRELAAICIGRVSRDLWRKVHDAFKVG